MKFILLMLMIGGLSGTSYLATNAVVQLSFNQALLKNQRIGGEVKNLLLKDITRINNSSYFYVPSGDNTLTDYTTLPTYFGSKRYSAGSVPFLYCPTSGYSITTGGDTVLLPDSDVYAIDTVSNPAKSGYNYVTGSSFKMDDVLAFVVSPLANATDIPSCNNITKQNGGYAVANGQLFTITKADVLAQNNIDTVHIERVNPTYTNDNTLEDGSEFNSKSLITNIEKFKNSSIKEMVIYLEDGTYNLPAGTMVSDLIKGKKLTLSSSGSAIINTPTIDFKGVDIEFNNVDTNADIVAKTSRLTLDGTEIGSITAKGADIRAMDSRVVGSTTLNGSTLRVSDTFDFGQVQALSGSNIDFIEANGTIEGTSLGIGIAGSTVSIDGSTVAIAGSTAINNQGELVVWNSTVSSTGATYGILSSNGGINRISNSDMFLSGTQPTYAFFDDNGTALVAGNGSFSGGQCFEGEIFDDLATITTVENGTQTVPNPNDQQNWTCL
jgi:hypothetical protein